MTAKLTRKHYVVLAEALREARRITAGNVGATFGVLVAVDQVVEALNVVGDDFDEARFRKNARYEGAS